MTHIGSKSLERFQSFFNGHPKMRKQGGSFIQRLLRILMMVVWLVSTFGVVQPVKAEVPAGDSEYYIPGYSQDLLTILRDIDNDPNVGTTLHNVVTITVASDNATVYYDHWENGYLSGAAGDEVYQANRGDILTFESPSIPVSILQTVPRAGNPPIVMMAKTAFMYREARLLWHRRSGQLPTARSMPMLGKYIR
jgi:hypothetical protein